MDNYKNFNDIVNDFCDWMKDNEDLFDMACECIREREDDGKTYEVTITGLSYIDAQNVIDFGIEFGADTRIRMEGEE